MISALLIVAIWGYAQGMTTANAALVIDINYVGNSTFAPAFVNAKHTWESLLSGYQDGTVVYSSSGSSYVAGQTISSVFINASVATDDGVGGRLGQASVTQFAQDTMGFVLATDATIEFDADDVALLSIAELDALVSHEVAHAIGFGSLWTQNNVYVNGSGEFLGAHANLAWQNEFSQTGTSDVEVQGGLGTIGAHWNENLNGAGLTGITDSMGRDMRDELMTGWLNSNTFISDMTVASFTDIGFTARVVPVPEPASAVLLGVMSLIGVSQRRVRCPRK
ncbi:MAG: peptidase [Rubripirellula sp.]